MDVLQALDVVVVPFPFTDRNASKRRPALVVSGEKFNQTTGHSVLAMITSASQSAWAADVALADWKAAGLAQPCVARLKLFTLDHRLVIRKAGRLGKADARAILATWAPLLFSD
jgi:mRNA interferase MazF